MKIRYMMATVLGWLVYIPTRIFLVQHSEIAVGLYLFALLLFVYGLIGNIKSLWKGQY